MDYFLSPDAVLKRLEIPSIYHVKKDDLYELDEKSFRFLKKCAAGKGCSSKEREFIDYCLGEGLLTENMFLLKRPSVLKSPVPSLRYLELQITDRCNLRCKHCYIGDNIFSELSVKQIETILGEFEAMQGLRVMITGGEPLMHGSFQKINAMLPGFFVRKVLFTNGLLLDQSLLKILNVDEIQISIDGLEDAHDALRGKGTFKKALHAVEQAVGSGFEVSIATMVHNKNLGDFDKMDRIFGKMGIKDWTVDIPCLTGRLRDNPDFMIPPEVGGKYLKYGHGEGLHGGAGGYACGLHLMAVMSDGRIAKCSFYGDKPVGSIKEGLRECWRKIKPLRLADLQCDCDAVEICRGGCRYRASQQGNPLGKDLYKCYFYDKI